MKGVSFLLKYLLPIVIIIILFSVYTIAGIAALLVFLVYMVYSWRPSFYVLMGGVQYKKGLTEETLNRFKRAYDTKRASSKAVISYGYLLLKTGNPDEAGTVLEALLAKKPSRDEELYALSNLALVQWKQGDLDKAISTLQKVIVDYKTSAVYGSLGYFFILKGDLDKALEFNLEAYDYNSSDKVILDNLGQTYYLKGIYDKSLEIYEGLTAKNPGFPEAYYNYALLLEKLDRREEATEMLKKALDSKYSYLSDITRDMVAAKLEALDTGGGR